VTTTPKLLTLLKAWLTDADLNDCVGGPFNEGAAFARRDCAAELEEAILADRADRDTPLPASEAPVAWQARMSADGRTGPWSDWPLDKKREPTIGRWSVEYRALYTAPASVPEGVRELVEAANRMGMAVSDHLRAGKLQCGSCEDDLSQLRTALAHPVLRAFIGSEK
jgi:hypothetical protein